MRIAHHCRIPVGLFALILGHNVACDAGDTEPTDALRVDLTRFGIEDVISDGPERHLLVDAEGATVGQVKVDAAAAGLAAEVQLSGGSAARIGWSDDEQWLQCGSGPLLTNDSDPALVEEALAVCGDEFDVAMMVAASAGADVPGIELEDEEFRQAAGGGAICETINTTGLSCSSCFRNALDDSQYGSHTGGSCTSGWIWSSCSHTFCA